MARIYVLRGDGVIVVSRRRPGVLRLRPVPRPWNTLAEIPPRTGRQPGETALVFAPPVALGALAAAFAPPEVGVAVGGAALIASTYLTPVLRGRLAGRRLRRPENIILYGERSQSAFDRSVAIADRISETWPALGPLVDTAEASIMLAEALWQIAAVLARRAELDSVLATDPMDLGEASIEVRSQVSAAKAARARVEAEFVRREASLRRAEDAGRDFIREQQMRQAVRAAEQTLRSVPPGLSAAGLSSAGLSSDRLPDGLSLDGLSPDGLSRTAALSAGPAGLDAGADLADQTRSVLAAYRELTADLTPD